MGEAGHGLHIPEPWLAVETSLLGAALPALRPTKRPWPSLALGTRYGLMGTQALPSTPGCGVVLRQRPTALRAVRSSSSVISAFKVTDLSTQGLGHEARPSC